MFDGEAISATIVVINYRLTVIKQMTESFSLLSFAAKWRSKELAQPLVYQSDVPIERILCKRNRGRGLHCVISPHQLRLY